VYKYRSLLDPRTWPSAGDILNKASLYASAPAGLKDPEEFSDKLVILQSESTIELVSAVMEKTGFEVYL